MEFTKMHGAGNSFVIIEVNTDYHGIADYAKKYCNAGTHPLDGLIAILPPSDPDADFDMLFYNRDGSLGEMCGNGARCAARYGFEHGYAKDDNYITFKATAGLIVARKINKEIYEIRLNNPSVAVTHQLVEGYDCGYVELGCPGIPHAIVEIDFCPHSSMEKLRPVGALLRSSPDFPKGANVTFAYKTGENHYEALTYERGVEDFTLACGTGCGALSTIMALRNNLSGNEVFISMPGGDLSVKYSKHGNFISDLLLKGPTAYMQ